MEQSECSVACPHRPSFSSHNISLHPRILSRACTSQFESIIVFLASSPTMVTSSTAKKKTSVVSPPAKAKAKSAKSKASNRKASPSRILPAIKGLHQRGIDQPLRKLVANHSGYEYTRSFQNILGKLKKKGFLDYPSSDTVRLTDDGMQEAGGDVAALTNEEIRKGIREKLKGKEIGFFDFLLDGRVRSSEEVKVATHCEHLQDRSFNNIFSKLKAHGILDYVKNSAEPKKKFVQLNDTVFPFGRPSS